MYVDGMVQKVSIKKDLGVSLPQILYELSPRNYYYNIMQ